MHTRSRGRRPGFHRRFRRGGWGLWDWGLPYPTGWDPDWTGAAAAPDGPGHAGTASASLSAAARQTLQRQGLLSGIWRRRMATAPAELIDFANRFHVAGGFARVLEDFFGDPLQAAVARMALRWSRRLTGEDPQAAYDLHFDRRIAFAPDGKPILTLTAGYRGVHYRFMPWRRFHPASLRSQLRRDALVFGQPERVRWVFRLRWVKSPRRAAARLRSLLGDDGGWPGASRWTGALDRLVTAV